MDRLRDDPRFARLLKLMKLSAAKPEGCINSDQVGTA
jgi:hypothetical protein